MNVKKEPVDVAASTGKMIKDSSVVASPSCNYITYSGKITRERCFELIDLIVELNHTVTNCDASMVLSDYTVMITLAFEFGARGYAHYEHFHSDEDENLNRAEAAMRKVIEGATS